MGVTALIGSSFVAATPSFAAPGDPFDPTEPTVFIIQGNPAQLQRAETGGDGSFEFSNEGPSRPFAYNALGFNPADNYLYGMVTTGNTNFPQGSLIRIGKNGLPTRIGTQIYQHPGTATNRMRFFVGAFNPDNGLYYVADSGPNQTILAINVTTGAVVQTINLGQVPGVQDFAFKDGYAWG